MSSDLTALLGSRICHDLISPLGAIGNGVELLSMSGLSAAPEIALIAESVENANARIRFFRVAYGAAPDGMAMSSTEIRSILDDLTKGGRLRIDWQDRGDPARTDAKLCFLLIQCLETALAWGGSIQVTQGDAGWTLIGQAERLRRDPELWARLADPPGSEAEVSSADVHFALVPELAMRLGRRIVTELGEAEIRISF